MAGIDTGYFQVNDIVLDVPPTGIKFQRDPYLAEYQTLRTRNSIKVKSGYSQIHVVVNAVFADEIGFEKLRQIVAQVKVVPFCYIKNQYISNNLFEGDEKETIILALKKLELVKTNQTTNVIEAVFNFVFFNYKPYLPKWQYRADIFSPLAVDGPINSNAWKLMAKAEMVKGKYEPIQNGLLNDRFVFGSYEYIAPIAVGTESNSDKIDATVAAYNTLKKKVNSTNSLSSALRKEVTDFFGTSTSMGSNLFSSIQGSDKQGNTVWHEGLLWEFIKSQDNQYQVYNGNLLLRRQIVFDTDNPAIPVTNVSVTIAHNLALIPIIGQDYPTYQHISSPGMVASVQMMADSENSLRKVNHFYHAMEKSEIEFRNIPPEQKRVKVQNDILNLCGMHECALNQMLIQTVPGQVGIYAIDLVLLDDSFENTETFNADSAFTSQNIRIRLADIALRYIKFNDIAKPNHPRESDEGDANTDIEIYNSDPYVCTIRPDDWSKAKFRDFCMGYAKILSGLYSDLAYAYDQASRHYNAGLQWNDPRSMAWDTRSSPASILSDIDALSEGALPGIKRVQSDLWHYAVGAGIDKNNIVNPIAGANQSAIDPVQLSDDQDQADLQRLKELIPRIEQNEQSNRDSSQLATDMAEYETIMSSLRATAQQRAANRLKSNRRELEDAQKRLTALNSGLANADTSLSDTASLIRQRQTEEVMMYSLQRAIATGGLANQFNASEYARLDYPPIDMATIAIKHARALQQFFDKWSAQGILNEPLCKTIAEAIMRELMVTNNRNVAYPDFPIKELVDLLQVEAKDIHYELRDWLFTQWKDKGLNIQGLSPAVLINPDFYLINPSIDMSAGSFDKDIVEKVKDTTQKGLASYNTVRKNFLSAPAAAYTERNSAAMARQGVRNKTSQDDFARLQINADDMFGRNASTVKQEMQDQSIYMDPEEFTSETFIPDAIASSSEDDLAIEILPFNNKLQQSSADQDYLAELKQPMSMSPSTIADQHRIIQTAGGMSIAREKSTVSLGASYAPSDILAKSKTVSWCWPLDIPDRANFLFTPVYTTDIRSSVEVPAANGQPAIHVGDLIKHAGDPHGAIDFNSVSTGQSTDGFSVFAAADGELSWVNNDGGIVIKHPGGFTSIYDHMRDEYYFREMQDKFRRGDTTVRKHDQIGVVGNRGRNTSGAHLHFEIRYKNQQLDPNAVINQELYNPRAPVLADSAKGESLLSKLADAFSEKLTLGGQGTGLVRAYPTFKLYFIERDTNERRMFGMDDLFSYAAVKQVQVIRNKYIPADLVQIVVTNISGVLSNRKFKNMLNPITGFIESAPEAVGRENVLAPQKTNTAQENPLVSILLQPGVEIQLKMGYNNNPSLLEDVFNGKITEVQSQESDDYIIIIAQSYGTELAQHILGVDATEQLKSGDTRNIIEQMLARPELVHFGRWERDSTNTGQYYDVLKDKWLFKNTPRDINNFGPGGDQAFDLYKKDQPFNILRTTAWDVLQEMTLRHPGTACMVLPFGDEHGPRNTLYFGLPNQLYFARDPTPQELEFSKVLTQISESVDKLTNVDQVADLATRLKYSGAEVDAQSFAKTLLTLGYDAKARTTWFKYIKESLATRMGLVRPVRAYHIATSETNIIANNISSSDRTSFNTVCLEYSKDNANATKAADTENNTQTDIPSKDFPIMTTKADADMPDEEVREFFAKYVNCIGEAQAKRYSVSLLWQSLKKSYRGNLILTGDPQIKPWDVIWIYDSYNDMYGPIEVEQVVLTFSEENGFIAEVKPEAVLHVNETATMATDEVMGALATHYIGKIGGSTAEHMAADAFSLYRYIEWARQKLPTLPGASIRDTITSTLMAPVNYGPLAGLNLMLWGTRKILFSSQYNHPFRLEPLMYKQRPLMCGISHKGTARGILYKLGEMLDEGKLGWSVMAAEVPGIAKDIKYSLDPTDWSRSLGSAWNSFLDKDGYIGPVGNQ
jgi:murein DD-endopeptidase MepM/ murein hydrolase activator NlpD